MTLLFFCLKIWGVLSALGQLGVLVPVDLVLYGAKFGVLRACFLFCCGLWAAAGSECGVQRSDNFLFCRGLWGRTCKWTMGLGHIHRVV